MAIIGTSVPIVGMRFSITNYYSAMCYPTNMRLLSTVFNRSYIRQVYTIVLNYSSYSRSYLYS